MLSRTLILSLALSVSGLRVQQRGADVTISENQTLQLKREKSTHAAGEGTASPGCTSWAEGAAPIYVCSAKDLWAIFLFQINHPWRCIRGLSAAAATDTVLMWGSSNTVWGGYKPTRPTSWEARYDCIMDNPMKMKALWDPLHLVSYGGVSSRWLDPFGIWEGDSGTDAIVKRYYSQNSQLLAPCTSSACVSNDCSDEGRYRNLATGDTWSWNPKGTYFKYSIVTAGTTELQQHGKMLMNKCYKRQEFNQNWDLKNTKYVQCRCSTQDLKYQWKYSKIQCRVKSSSCASNLFSAYDFNNIGMTNDQCWNCDTFLMRQQLYGLWGAWNPYQTTQVNGLLSTTWDQYTDAKGHNGMENEVYCGASGSKMWLGYYTGWANRGYKRQIGYSWNNYNPGQYTKWTKNFKSPGQYIETVGACEDAGELR